MNNPSSRINGRSKNWRIHQASQDTEAQIGKKNTEHWVEIYWFLWKKSCIMMHHPPNRILYQHNPHKNCLKNPRPVKSRTSKRSCVCLILLKFRISSLFLVYRKNISRKFFWLTVVLNNTQESDMSNVKCVHWAVALVTFLWCNVIYVKTCWHSEHTASLQPIIQ